MEISPQYLAGYLDGDGTLTISMNTTAARNYPSLQGKIMACSVDLQFLEELKAQFGGHVQRKYGTKEPPNHRRVYQWDVAKIEDVAKIIQLIKPHLILKQDHVKILEEFIKIRQERHTQPYVKREFEIWLEMRELNLRGKKSNRLQKDRLEKIKERYGEVIPL